jgi:hypothetical protein
MPKSTLTVQHLTSAIKQLPTEFAAACCDGHCDAFALALTKILTQHGVACKIQVGSREEIDEDDKSIDNNPLSHVVVKAFGTTWDANGPNACFSWESLWNTYEHLPPYHVFDWDDCGPKGLWRLRRTRDAREIDSEYIAQTLRYLGATVINPARLTEIAP